MRKLVAVILILGSFSAFGSNINCLGELEDGFQVNICSRVIDTNKLETIDCNQLEDGYSVNLCKRARHPLTGEKLNCLRPQDSAEMNFCSTVPKRDTVSVINCLGPLENGYEAQICSRVNVKKQQRLWNQLNK
ncbi:MAG: hypothetical protein NDI69_17740 [Bacteriovoracaceae bacterium]|nr:hypothetical protein [Bacteriovoracaceae bacterium]